MLFNKRYLHQSRFKNNSKALNGSTVQMHLRVIIVEDFRSVCIYVISFCKDIKGI